MKRHLAYALAGLMLASCVSTGVEMTDEARFAQLVKNVESWSALGTTMLKSKLSEKARTTLLALTEQIELNGNPPAHISLSEIADAFGYILEQNGVDAKEIALVKASMLLIDSALGGVQLGSAGVGSEQTNTIVLAICKGMAVGLK